MKPFLMIVFALLFVQLTLCSNYTSLYVPPGAVYSANDYPDFPSDDTNSVNLLFGSSNKTTLVDVLGTMVWQFRGINEFYKAFLNKYPTGKIPVNGTNMTLLIYLLEDEYNGAKLAASGFLENFRNLTNTFYISSVFSVNSNLIYPIFLKMGKLVVASSSIPESIYSNTKLLFSTSAPPERFMEVTYPYMRNNGLYRLGLIYPVHPFLGGACNVTNEKIRFYGKNLTVVSNKVVSFTQAATLSDAQKKEIKNVVDAFHEADVEVVNICLYPAQTQYFMQYMMEANINFKMINSMPDNIIMTGKEWNMQYINFVNDNFEQYINLPPDSWYGVPAEYWYYTNKTYGSVPKSNTYSRCIIAGRILVDSIVQANTTHVDTVAYYLSRFNADTVAGRISFSGDNVIDKTIFMIQIQNGKRVVVAPPLASYDDMIVPIPTWEQRVFKSDWTQAEQAYFGIGIALIAFSLSLVCFVIAKRKDKVILASSPVFLISMIFGGILMYVSVLLWPANGLSTPLCHLHIYFLVIGFFILFGSLFGRSWRIYQMYTSPLEKITISDLKLSLILGLITLMAALILICYSVWGGVERHVNYTKPYIYTNHREYCAQNHYGDIFMYIILSYMGVTLIFGIYIGIKIKSIPFVLFDESKIILFSMYNVVFFFIFTVCIIYVEALIDVVAAYLLRSSCIYLCPTITLCTFFYSKLRFIKKGLNPRQKKTTTSSGHTADKSNNFKYEKMKQQIEKLMKKNEELKKQISDLATV